MLRKSPLAASGRAVTKLVGSPHYLMRQITRFKIWEPIGRSTFLRNKFRAPTVSFWIG